MHPRPHAAARIIRAGSADPILDRIDLTLEVQPLSPTQLSRAERGETTEVVARRVAAARDRQRARYAEEGIATNAEADGMSLELTEEARTLAERAAEQLRLSPRGQSRVRRVARTIADLGGMDTVERQHVAEALSFRHKMPGRKV